MPVKRQVVLPEAVAVGLLLLGGCSTVEQPFPVFRGFVPDATRLVRTGNMAPDGTNRADLATAVVYALTTSPKIQMLEAQVGRRQGDLKAVSTIESPELRLAHGRSSEEGMSWSSGTESGISSWTATERSESTTREGALVSTARGEDRTSGRSRFLQTSSSAGASTQEEPGYSIGLRLVPPNPWEMRAALETAEAARVIAEAELVVEQQNLVCDIFEASVGLGYYSRMRRIRSSFAARCRDVQARAMAAWEQGAMSGDDYSDVCRLFSSAETDVDRLASRMATLRQEFGLLTGMEAARVNLSLARCGRIFPKNVFSPSNGNSKVILSLAQSRPDSVGAYWTVAQCRGELGEGRARRIPWVTYLGGSYSWWEASSRQAGTSTSTQADREWGTTETIQEDETSVRTGTQWQDSFETSSTSGAKEGGESSEGDEWQVEVGITIPIFEWTSRETASRRAVVRATELGLERMISRTVGEIGLARQEYERARAECMDSLALFRKEASERKKQASALWSQGIAGQVEALRIEQGVVDKLNRLMEQAMETAMAEVNLCRASGIVPGSHLQQSGGTAAVAAEIVQEDPEEQLDDTGPDVP